MKNSNIICVNLKGMTNAQLFAVGDCINFIGEHLVDLKEKNYNRIWIEKGIIIAFIKNGGDIRIAETSQRVNDKMSIKTFKSLGKIAPIKSPKSKGYEKLANEIISDTKVEKAEYEIMKYENFNICLN